MTRRAEAYWRQAEQGFTLLELILALGIMALGVAVVLPFFNASRAGYQLQASAYEIASQLREARVPGAEPSTAFLRAMRRAGPCPPAWPSMSRSPSPSNSQPILCASASLPMAVPAVASFCCARAAGRQP